MIRDPPQHLIWPLESKAQEKSWTSSPTSLPVVIAVVVTPVPKSINGRKSPIAPIAGGAEGWETAASLDSKPSWPLLLPPAFMGFQISIQPERESEKHAVTIH